MYDPKITVPWADRHAAIAQMQAAGVREVQVRGVGRYTLRPDGVVEYESAELSPRPASAPPTGDK